MTDLTTCKKCKLTRAWPGDSCPICGEPRSSSRTPARVEAPSPSVPTVPASITNMDAVAFLRTLEDGTVDVIITDIAYESMEKHRKIGTTTRLKNSKGSSNAWFEIFKNDRIPELLAEMFRVLKKNAHLYFFCDADTMFVAKPMGEVAGFKFWKPIIWDKVAIGMGYHYRARCERILFFEKGKRKLNNLGIPDVLAFKRVHKGYPTEKPVDLLKVLVEQSTDEGQTVVDPFCGSGSTGVAAAMAGRHFLGNDLSEGACVLARRRVREAGGVAP